MPEYLLSGQDPQGRKVTESVEAPSTDEAVDILREDGYTNIVLHPDEIVAIAMQSQKVLDRLSPRDRVKMLHAPMNRFVCLYILRKAYLNITVLVLILLVVLHWLVSGSWGIIQWLGLTVAF